MPCPLIVYAVACCDLAICRPFAGRSVNQPTKRQPTGERDQSSSGITKV